MIPGWKVFIVMISLDYHVVLGGPTVPTEELCHYEVGRLMRVMVHTDADVAFKCERVK